jgi:hypothetical protein
LIDALENLDNLIETVENAYLVNLQDDTHEKWEEKS